MRNLKKILSLALALVMVFSLMTFASAQDFNDAADIEHTEAVEVLTTLEVIDGVGNNTFNPTGKVTRAQMAKMITLISLGNVSVDAFKGTTTDLNDIEGHWAEAFIKYCYSQGIISGKGNGRFDPDANVTTVEAAKMLLVAIGYNSDVQIYEGPQWTVNVIRDAQLSGFFDKVALPADTQINRDQAAQMMYNALNADIIEKTSVVNRTDGTISDEYTPKENYSLLNKAFDGKIWVGTFTGNHDFNADGAAEGEITVTGALEADYDPDDAGTAAHFPYDYDIANIGEEVKVIFKDGTMGNSGRPDKNDTIYGVYKTGATSVVNATRDNVGDQKSNKAQIKVSGTTYNTEDTVKVYFNYNASDPNTNDNPGLSAINGNSSTNSALTSALKVQKSDLIKLILNDKNRVETVYVAEYGFGRVSSVTSSKVTIDGVGAIEIEDNSIYDGIAVDDVAVYTKFYDTDKDDAYFTVTLAETVEGALTGYKKSNSNSLTGNDYDNVVVAGTTYKLYGKTLENLSDDDIDTSDFSDSSSKVGDEVRAFMVNGMVAGLQALEESGGKYALVVDVNTTGTLGSKLEPIRVTVLLTDGTEQTLKVHKDSVSDGAGGTPISSYTQLQNGVLIEYSSISDDEIKIYSIATPVQINGAGVAGCDLLWDKDAKTLAYAAGADTSTANPRAVAASNATMFVVVDKLAASNPGNNDGQLDDNEDYYAYDMRSLSDIANIGAGAAKNGRSVSVYRNDDGLVTAAYVVLTNRPTRGGDNTLYGIVTNEGGYVEESGTGYRTYTIDTGKDEPLSIMVESTIAARNLRKGDIVEFDESSDGKYVATDFTKLLTAGSTTPGHETTSTPAAGWTLGAINSYDSGARRLSYFTGTSRTSTTASFTGTPATPISITATSDVKFAYIDSDNTRGGDEMSLRKFNTANGYANVLFHTDDSGLVDVIIYEVSGEGNLAVYGDSTDKVGNGIDGQFFGATNLAKTAVLGTPALTTPTAGGGNTITSVDTDDSESITINVVTNTPSVVFNTDKATAQSLALASADADVTINNTTGVVTVNTTDEKDGGTKTFNLVVSEADKSSRTYAVTIAVAAGPIDGTSTSTSDLNTALDEAGETPVTVTGDVTADGANITIPDGATVTFAGDVAPNASETLSIGEGATVIFQGDVTTDVTVNGGDVTVEDGKSIAKVSIGATAGTTITGDVDEVTAVAESAAITGTVGEVKAVTAAKTLTVTGDVTTISGTAGTVAVTGSVTTINAASATGTITVTEDVTTVTANGATLTVEGTITTLTATTGAVTADAITTLTDMSANVTVSGNITNPIGTITDGTLSLGGTATINDSTTLTDGEVAIGENGTLTLNATNGAVNTTSGSVTISGVAGAKVIATPGSNTITVANNLFYDDGSDLNTATQNPNGTYVCNDDNKFVKDTTV